MSFTFRDLFSEEDGASGADSAGQEGERMESSGSSDVLLGEAAAKEGAESAGPSASFLVSELLAFIPPAISAQSGIPMEKEISIPLPAGGGSDVSLSTIYQICPELFAAEITPLNDSVVTLPAKLGQMESVEAGGSSPLGPPASSFGTSGFQSPETSASPQGTTGGQAGESESNPFWSPQPSQENPSQGAESIQSEAPSLEPVSPFGAGSGEGNPFDPPSSSPPPQVPQNEGKMPGGFDDPVAKDKVFEAGEHPSAPMPSGGGPFTDSPSPGESSKDQVEPTGFSENPFDSSEGFSTLFSKQAAEDSDIPVPGGNAGAEADDAGNGWGALFQPESGAAGKAEATSDKPPIDDGAAFQGLGEMIQGSGPEVPSAEPKNSEPEKKAEEVAVEDPLAGFGAGFENLANSEKVHEEESVGSTPDSAAFLGGQVATPEPSNESNSASSTGSSSETGTGDGFQAFVPVSGAKKPKPEGSDPTASDEAKPSNSFEFSIEPKSESVATTQEPEEKEPQAEGAEALPFQSSPVESPKVENAASAIPGGIASLATPEATQDCDESLRQLEFRAIFSTDESFTLANVARRVIGIPGINGCALATPSRIVQASRNEESRLGDEAKEMVDTIRNLAKLTGIPEARSFTLHTDKGTVSLFLEEECCLTIHHDEGAFGPGVREKLILIARSIHKLEE